MSKPSSNSPLSSDEIATSLLNYIEENLPPGTIFFTRDGGQDPIAPTKSDTEEVVSPLFEKEEKAKPISKALPVKKAEQAAPPPLEPLPTKAPEPPLPKQIGKFTLEPITPAKYAFDSEMEKKLLAIRPQMPLSKAPLSDSRAKQVKEGYRTKQDIPNIPLLYSARLIKDRPFLTSLAQAIDTRLGPCHLVDIDQFEKNNNWSSLFNAKSIQLIIAPDQLILNNPNLLPHFRETENQNIKTLGDHPLLMLFNINMYYQAPKLKKALWKLICSSYENITNR
ncbi:MAG: hypothetical protein S4CHLAM102_03120 [Chlamydiia bacterium]|nr:hypothetical protein [Chlamydiia bacterium]